MAHVNPPTFSGDQCVVIRDPIDLDNQKRALSSDSEGNPEPELKKHSGARLSNGPVPLFLSARHGEEGKNLQHVSPFLINKAFVGAGGSPKSIRKLRNGTLLIEATNEKQAKTFLKMRSFYNQIPIVVEPHTTLNTSKGVVFSRDLLDCTVDEIKEELATALVCDVVRINKKEGGKDVPTPGLILTFATPHPPENIKAGYLSLSVRPYFRNPQRCFKCQRFGHSSKACSNVERCCRCGQPDHNEDACTAEECCANCKGKHKASSRECKCYMEEKATLKIATERKLSFTEARKVLRQLTPAPNRDMSFAQAAASAKASSSCTSCSALQETIRALSEQVAMLVKQLSATPQSQTSADTTPQPPKQPKQIQPTKTVISPSSQKPSAQLSEERKKLQQKLKNNIRGKVEMRAKGNKSASQSSINSSILDEDTMDDDLLQRTVFQTTGGKFNSNPVKGKNKITFKK